MKTIKLHEGWYQLIGHQSGIKAGFRRFSRGVWGVYFRHADGSCAFGMKPGEELTARSSRHAKAIAINSLNSGKIVSC